MPSQEDDGVMKKWDEANEYAKDLTLAGRIVKIPFRKEFKDKILNGEKTMTTRTRPYGGKGDCFWAFGALFILESVRLISLCDVAIFHHKKEGFDTVPEFKDCWNRIHPRKRYQPDRLVYLHEFREVDPNPGTR